jgi:hypothetical protein
MAICRVNVQLRVASAADTITVLGEAIQPALTAKTNAEGDYAFSFLSPGNYRVEFRAAGFSRAFLDDELNQQDPSSRFVTGATSVAQSHCRR